MVLELTVWLTFLAPLASFLVIVFVVRPAGAHLLAGWVTIACVGIAFAASLLVLGNVLAVPGHELPMPDIPWLTVGGLQLHIGLAVDSLTAVMLLVATSISLLVQVYSTAYMHERVPDDPAHAPAPGLAQAGAPVPPSHGASPPRSDYSRYYAYMSLFTASMVGLVLADNLLQLFVFWELVGLCSFLLIGFWFHRPIAAAAAKKAFVVTRLGDLGFLIALLVVANTAGTLTIKELFKQESIAALGAVGFLGASALTWVALGLFAGAAGKSAQFPLHVWLPDAMEGPTPVSALIHAATMVAAGVYLVGRMLPLIEESPEAMGVIAFLGAFTALIAAGLGLVMHDIKRVMAYSTISQLGYMMLALGVGGYVAAFFHLMNHAFFKALLFLGAGSVSHGTQDPATGHTTFDMRYYGGLRKTMPVTFWTLLIASLSLAGIPPFSGFWSKDEILGAALGANPLLFAMALATVFMTAFYVFRMILMTVWHEYRGGAAAELAGQVRGRPGGPTPLPSPPPQGGRGPGEPPQGGRGTGHANMEGHGGAAHESPGAMIVPLVILAVPSVLSGFLNTPVGSYFEGFMDTTTLHETLRVHHAAFSPLVASVSVLVALLGTWLAWEMYGSRRVSTAPFAGLLGGRVYRFLYQKYGLDFLYEHILVRGVLYGGVVTGLALFDRYVVDGAVNGVGRATRWVGGGLRRVESGQVQAYGLAIFLGLVVLTAGMLVRG